MLSKIEHFLGRSSNKVDSQHSAKEAPLPTRIHSNQGNKSVAQDLDELINWAHKKGKK